MMIPEPYDIWLEYLAHFLCVYCVISFILKEYQRIKQYAWREIEQEKSRKKSSRVKSKEVPQVKTSIETNATIVRRRTIATTTPNPNNEACNSFGRSSLVNNGFHNCRDADDFRGTYSVAKIAHEYERRAQKQKIHVASPDKLEKRHTLAFFEGLKMPDLKVDKPSPMCSTVQLINTPAPEVKSSPLRDTLDEIKRTLSISKMSSQEERNGDNIIDTVVNGQLSENKADSSQQRTNSNNLDLKSMTSTVQYEPIVRRKRSGQVETFEDILIEQRFSRSLSSYSISDLLKDQPPEPNIDQLINEIH